MTPLSYNHFADGSSAGWSSPNNRSTGPPLQKFRTYIMIAARLSRPSSFRRVVPVPHTYVRLRLAVILAAALVPGSGTTRVHACWAQSPYCVAHDMQLGDIRRLRPGNRIRHKSSCPFNLSLIILVLSLRYRVVD